ncbi:hypothetical protein SAG0181_06435 [Streptococcus agalactiae LDS 628]|nr:hypothetical protein SAG0181_05425 [Streptococcus agalactiae LDS 628]EPU43168.1 hypothetical protein SAG0181_06435 [Streptococcus agalactiae LDS 628]
MTIFDERELKERFTMKIGLVFMSLWLNMMLKWFL